MTRVIKAKTTTAAALIKAAQVNGYDYEQQKVLLDKLSIDSYGAVFYFADYSAIECNDSDQSFTELYGPRRDFAEIAMRIQNFKGIAADCPAYLRSDFVKWLRENDVD